MKKQIVFIAFSLVLALSCSRQRTAEKDTFSTNEPVTEKKKEPVNIMTSEGVGPLKIGMPMNDIPSSVEGLYDKFEKTKEDEFGDDCLAFYNLMFYKDDKLVMEGRADDGDCTQNFQLASLYAMEDTLVKISIDGVLYGCNDDIANLLKNNKLKQEGTEWFEKDTYLYQGVEINLTNHLHIKRGTVIRRLEVVNRDLYTPIPEDFVP